MTCPRCQQENLAEARFCMKCGSGLTLACAKCNAELPTGAAFCFACGQPVTAAPGRQRFTSPEAYTPRHLAEKILTSKSALEGERKQVTVLFADLKGSMELLADRDPEEARKLLDPVLEHMMEAVHRYEGTVNQVMGDGIMALFGAPLAHEDHAVRACYAALRIQASVNRYAEGVRRSEGVLIQIRVGLNSGEVVVRSIGNDLRMDYSAVGQTTHLAARMEQLAAPGTILMTADTLRLTEGYVAVKELGPVPVKGLEHPLEVYEILGAGPTRTRLQAAAARGLTRFVGRDAELDALRRALDKARAGHGQLVALVGEPGVGKSRLFWEFTHSHRTQGWLILESSSVSYGKATPYLPVIDLLKGYFQIEARDDGRRIREKLIGKLLALDEALRPTLPAFLALLDASAEDPQWQALDPLQRRQQTLDAVKRLLIQESQVQPLLLVFEDLHWIDSETQALIDSLVESLPTARLLLLVNYRPEYQHGWGSKTYYSQLRIDPLPPESAEELLQALLGDGVELQPLKRLLIERTEGNPFFLEESVRTLVETKALIGERGAYRLAQAIPAIQVPGTVQAVLAARIDRLPPEDKSLLQVAAVVGKDVPFSLLKAVADLPEESLRGRLADLQSAEFLYETSLFPDLEYTFKHALTHEVAYGSLLHERRRVLHARIVEAIEGLLPDRLAEHAERLGHHAVRGEVWEKAVDYLHQAGTKAAWRSADREAVAFFEQALAALGHLPERRDTRQEAIDIRHELHFSLLQPGEVRLILDNLREAERLAIALGDDRRLAWFLGPMANYFWIMGDPRQALELSQRILSIANALGDSALRINANQGLGVAYHSLGQYRPAIESLRSNVEALGSRVAEPKFPVPVLSRNWLIWCLAEVGEFPEGIALGQDIIRLADVAQQPMMRVSANVAIGGLHLIQGEIQRAIPALERAVALCREWSLHIWYPASAARLGSAYALAGRTAEALPLLEQAATRRGSHQGLRLGYLGEAYLYAGRREDAIQRAQQALAASRHLSERGYEAWALRLLGEIHAQGNPPDAEQAEAAYRQAMARGEELGTRPLVAHCHLGLGKLYRRTGKREQAQEHLTSATTMYREMGMRFWLEQAEAEMGRLA